MSRLNYENMQYYIQPNKCIDNNSVPSFENSVDFDQLASDSHLIRIHVVFHPHAKSMNNVDTMIWQKDTVILKFYDIVPQYKYWWIIRNYNIKLGGRYNKVKKGLTKSSL